MQKNTINNPGHLITNGVVLERHEYNTINVLLSAGLDVELVVKSRTPHSKSPDIYMMGMLWEMKAPTGKTLRAIERILHRAIKQSSNIVMDLRRTPMSDEILCTAIEKFFHNMRPIRSLWIITKSKQIVRLKKG